MSVTTLRPTSTVANGTSTIGGGAASRHAALADDSDTTYVDISSTFASPTLLAFTAPTLPAGAVPISVILRLRLRSAGSSGTMVYGVSIDAGGDVAFNGGVIGINNQAWSVAAVSGDFSTLEIGLWKAGGTDALRVFEAYLDLYYVVPPVVTVTAPTGTLIDTTAPLAEWTVEVDEIEPLQRSEARLFTDAVYGATGFDPEIPAPLAEGTGDIKTIASGQTWQLPSIPDGTYRVYVRGVGRDSTEGEWAYSEFTLDTPRADPPLLELTPNADQARVEITVGEVGIPPDYFELQRSDDEGATWVPVRTPDTVPALGTLVNDDGVASVDDYEAPNGVTVTYRARGITVYSAHRVAYSTWTQASTIWSSSAWWLKHPTHPALNFKLDDRPEVFLRSNAQINQAVRQSINQPLGRSDPVIISDTPGPETGEITVLVSTLENQATLKALLATLSPVLLQGRQEDTWRDRWVVIGDTSASRVVDHSWSGLYDVTLPWTEVARPEGVSEPLERAERISYVGVGAATIGEGTATTSTPVIPDEIEVGDWMVVRVYTRANDRTLTWPSGWTEIYADSNSGGTAGAAWKFYEESDSDPAIGHDTTANMTIISEVIAFRGVASDPVDVLGTVGNFADGLTIGPIDGITPTTPGALFLLLTGVRNDVTAVEEAPSGDLLSWQRISYTTTGTGSDAAASADFAIAEASSTPEISDKTLNVTTAQSTLGSRGVFLAIAADPRPTGPKILAQDLAEDADPIPLWRSITSSFPQQDETNPQVLLLSASPFERVPVGASEASPNYRRLKLLEAHLDGEHTFPVAAVDVEDASELPPTGTLWLSNNNRFTYTGITGDQLTGCSGGTGTFPDGQRMPLQDQYAASSPGNTSYRVQLVTGSPTPSRNFYTYELDELTTTYLTTRFQAAGPLSGGLVSPYDDSMIWQMKQVQTTRSPILSMTEDEDGVRLIHNLGSQETIWTHTAPKETEINFAIQHFSSADPNVGWVRVWSDLESGAALEPLSDVMFMQTAYPPGSPYGGTLKVLSIGPYQRCETPALYRDYGNIQVVRDAELP